MECFIILGLVGCLVFLFYQLFGKDIFIAIVLTCAVVACIGVGIVGSSDSSTLQNEQVEENFEYCPYCGEEIK